MAPIPTEVPSVDLFAVTTRDLASAGRLDTILGQQAVALARRMANPAETGAGVASLSRELRAVLVEALGGVVAAADPLDELKARRDRIRAAG